jgi:hypothetical protein
MIVQYNFLIIKNKGNEMNCKIILINPKNNKILKSEIISVDRYLDAENIVIEKNKKIKEKFWKVSEINC